MKWRYFDSQPRRDESSFIRRGGPRYNRVAPRADVDVRRFEMKAAVIFLLLGSIAFGQTESADKSPSAAFKKCNGDISTVNPGETNHPSSAVVDPDTIVLLREQTWMSGGLR